MTDREYKEVGSREFQLTYQKLTEPVVVVSRSGGSRTIGYFYPGDTPPEGKPKDITLDDVLGSLPKQDADYMKRIMGKGRK